MEQINMSELPKPLGDWLLKQTDVAFRNFHDGAYWHYQSVLTLLKLYAAEQPPPSPVEVDATDLWNKYSESLQVVVNETECLFDRDVMTYTNFKKALAASSEETIKWIKASERLPDDDSREYVVKWEGGYDACTVAGIALLENERGNIFWLSESAPPSDTREDNQ